MTNREIKKRIDESPLILFSKADLYKLFDIKTLEFNNPLASWSDFFNSKKINKNLFVSYRGYSTIINENLLRAKGAFENLDSIKKLHIEKFKIFKKMEKTNDVEKLRNLANNIESIEYQLQELWCFPKDKNYHFWFDVPKCTCPMSDNMENRGTENRVIDKNCPIHGNEKLK